MAFVGWFFNVNNPVKCRKIKALEAYPVVDWNGGKSHKISGNIYHQSAIHYLGLVLDSHDAELTGYFERLYYELKFKKWFAGHFHVNKLVRDNIQILFDEVAVIE